MELFIKDRLYFSQLLPAQNTFMEFNLKKSIIEKVGLTDEDKKKFEIKEDKEAGKIVWNIEKDMKNPLVVDFTKEEIEYLRKGCEALTNAPFPDDFWVTVEKVYNALA